MWHLRVSNPKRLSSHGDIASQRPYTQSECVPTGTQALQHIMRSKEGILVIVCFSKEKMVPPMSEGRVGKQPANKSQSKSVQIHLRGACVSSCKWRMSALLWPDCCFLASLHLWNWGGCGVGIQLLTGTSEQRKKRRLLSPFSESIF